MTFADLSPLTTNSQLPVCTDAAVWTRSGFGPNLVVLTGDSVFVSKVARRELKTAEQRLQHGEPVVHVVGENSTSVFLGSIRKISTVKSSSDVCVEFEQARGRIDKLLVPLPDYAARDAFLQEARGRIPGNVEAVQRVGSRIAAALGPINALFLSGLLACGAQWFFNSRFSEMKLPDRKARTPRKAPREQRDPTDFSQARFQQNEIPETQGGRYPQNRAAASKLARGMVRHKRAAAALVLVLLILMAIAMGLSWVGYQTTMTILGGIVALSVTRLVWRLSFPSRTTELINTQKVDMTVW